MGDRAGRGEIGDGVESVPTRLPTGALGAVGGEGKIGDAVEGVPTRSSFSAAAQGFAAVGLRSLPSSQA